MKRLVLTENEFGDEGAVALLECLHNIQELSVEDCDISAEMVAMMKEHAEEVGVQVNVRNPGDRGDLAQSLDNASDETLLEILATLGIRVD